MELGIPFYNDGVKMFEFVTAPVCPAPILSGMGKSAFSLSSLLCCYLSVGGS